MCVFDAMRALDYLGTRPEVKRESIGCAGFSMGGTLAAWLAALDRRVKVCGISGWWGSWRARAATGEYQGIIIYLPAFLRYLDLNITVAAVTPTPMIVVHEHRDRLDEAEAFLAPVRQAYRGMKASEALRIEYMPGGHVWHGEIIVPWLAQQLGIQPHEGSGLLRRG